MKLSSKTLQNLPYFCNKKTLIVFVGGFHLGQLWTLTLTVDTLVYIDLDQGIHYYKSKVAQNEKQNKN